MYFQDGSVFIIYAVLFWTALTSSVAAAEKDYGYEQSRRRAASAAFQMCNSQAIAWYFFPNNYGIPLNGTGHLAEIERQWRTQRQDEIEEYICGFDRLGTYPPANTSWEILSDDNITCASWIGGYSLYLQGWVSLFADMLSYHHRSCLTKISFPVIVDDTASKSFVQIQLGRVFSKRLWRWMIASKIRPT